MSRTKLLAGMLALMLGFGSVGCATYVNIPAEVGDVASHDPNGTTVLKIEQQALRALDEKRPAAGSYRVVLPDGTNQDSYKAVVSKISDRATWWVGSINTPSTQPATTYEVRQVRVRGSDAEVDVIWPTQAEQPEGTRQLVTLSLKWDAVAGWNVSRIRPWNTTVEDALIRSVRQADIQLGK